MLGNIGQLNQGRFHWGPLATSHTSLVSNPQVPILWSIPITGTNLWQGRGQAGRRRGGEGKRAL